MTNMQEPTFDEIQNSSLDELGGCGGYDQTGSLLALPLLGLIVDCQLVGRNRRVGRWNEQENLKWGELVWFYYFPSLESDRERVFTLKRM